MKQETLFRAIGEIDETMIREAADPTVRRSTGRRGWRAGLIAAAAALLCLATAWAVAGSSGVRLFDSWEEMMSAPEDVAKGYTVRGDVTPAKDVTAEQMIRDVIEAVRHVADWSNKAVLNDEEEPSLVTFHYVDTPRSLTDAVALQDVFHPDLSYLERTLAPVEDTFCHARGTWRSPRSGDYTGMYHEAQQEDETLYEESVWGVYHTESGGVMWLSIGYLRQPDGDEPTHEKLIYSDSFDFREQATTADGSVMQFFGTGNLISGMLTLPYGEVELSCAGCTREEVLDQIEHLDLGDIPMVFTVGPAK